MSRSSNSLSTMSDTQPSRSAPGEMDKTDSLRDNIPLATLSPPNRAVGILQPGSDSPSEAGPNQAETAYEDMGKAAKPPRKSNDSERTEPLAQPHLRDSVLSERQGSSNGNSNPEIDNIPDHPDQPLPSASHTPDRAQSTLHEQSEHGPESVSPNQATRRTLNALNQREPKPDFGWLPWRLSWWWTAIMVALQMGIMVTFIGLERRSAAMQGFVEIPAGWSSSSGLFAHSAVWTTVPALLMGLYQRILFDPTLASFFARQPYVELPRKTGSTAARTILLDYMNVNEFIRWIPMFCNGHWHLAPFAVFSLLISFFLGPLTANTFQARPVLTDSTVNITALSSFDASFYGASVSANNLSFGAVIQQAGASINQDAKFPPWTIGNATFPKLAIDYTNSSSFGSNYSIRTNAWSGDLDCVAYSDSFTTSSNNVVINIPDRGCPIQWTLPLPPQKTWIQGWSTRGCSRSAGYNRVSFLYIRRDYPQTTIAETSFIACIPRYLNQSGILRIQNGSIDFAPGEEAASNIDPDNA